MGIRGFLFILISLFSLAVSAQLDQPTMTPEEFEDFIAMARRKLDKDGHATPDFQTMIREVEEQFRAQDSAYFLRFQKMVAEAGGILGDLPRMPEATESFWLEGHTSLHDFQSLPELPAKAKVVLVGAGLTNIGAAFYLMINKIPFVILERGGVAEGATGRNGGSFQPSPESFIEAYESLFEERFKRMTLLFPEMPKRERRLRAQAQTDYLLEFGFTNAKLFKNIVETQNINAYVKGEGHVRIANSWADMRALKRDVRDLNRHDVEARMLTQEEVFALTGIKTKYGGRLAPGFGKYDPVEFAYQFYQMIIDKKVGLLFTQTEVTGLDFSRPINEPVVVNTSRGPIEAEHVILGIDAAARELLPEHFWMVDPFQSHVMTFENATDTMKDHTGTQHHGDHYFNFPGRGQFKKWVGSIGKFVNKGVLLAGGGVDRFVENVKRLVVIQSEHDTLLRQTYETFPSERNKPPSRFFTGIFAFTWDRLPIIGLFRKMANGQYDPRASGFIGTQGYGGVVSILGGFLNAMIAMAKTPAEREAILKEVDPQGILSISRYDKLKSQRPGACQVLFVIPL